MNQRQQAQTKSNTKTLSILVVIVILMFGFGYAMVPLYNVLCDALGLNGKPKMQSNLATTVDTTRWITVQFVTNKNANLPWKFYALVTTVKVHPGENKQILFFAQNNSNHTMTVQAIPSLTPTTAAKFLKKTECFCFNQQTLKAGESIDMPMIFHIDPNLPKQMSTLTLSYTMFDTSGVRTIQNKIKGKIS